MTYTNIIASLDNMNYVGKKGQPIKRVEYRADITVITNTRTYTRTVFHKEHLGLMRNEQSVINSIMRTEWSKYNNSIKRGYYTSDEIDEPELLEVRIIETDRNGNVKEV